MAPRFTRQNRQYPVLGIIKNVGENVLDPRAWTNAHNVRFDRLAVKKIRGWSKIVSAAPDVAPVTLITRQQYNDGTGRNIVGTGKYIYTLTGSPSLTKLNTVAYANGASDRWIHDQWSGVSYFTNFSDVVQKLLPTSNAMAVLGGTPPKARCLEQFEGHLALGTLNVSGNAGYDEFANSGLDAPEDWNFTDTASEADLRDIPEGGDAVQRILRLGNYLAIYKENSVHLASYIGLPFVFSKQQISDTIGLRSPWGVTRTSVKGHSWVGQDNFYRFDGAGIQSIGDVVWPWFKQDCTPTAQQMVVAYHDPLSREVFFAYTSASGDQKALAWNYDLNVWSTRAWPFTAFGILPFGSETTWDTATGNWDDHVEQWHAEAAAAGMTPLAGDSNGNVYAFDNEPNYTADGADIEAELESGDDGWKDETMVKQLDCVFVDVSNVSGSKPLQMWVSGRMGLDDPITWQGPFTVSQTGRVDCFVTGRWFRYRFRKTGGYFELYGYAPNYTTGSLY